MYKEIEIQTRVDEQVYRAFSHFNTFKAFHKSVGYFVFPIAMVVFAVVNLKTGSLPLFIIFLAIGLGLPVFNIITYRTGINHQIKKLNLDGTKIAYTTILNDEGIHVSNEKEHADYPWNKVYYAYHTDNTVYLFLTKTRCFILPYKDIQGGKTEDDLWSFFRTHLESYQLKESR
jgi:hypothetical protein